MTTTKTQLKTIAAAIVMAVALTSVAPAMAAKEGDPTGLFVGGGMASTKLSCDSGFTCPVSDDTVPYFYIGGMGDENFGAELGYLGKSEYEVSREERDGRVRLKGEHSSLHANIIGRYPFNDHIAVFGKLGVSYAFTDAKIIEDTRSPQSGIPIVAIEPIDLFEDIGFLIGGGLEVQAGNFAGRLEYNILENDDVAYGGVSIIYRFR